MSAKRPNPKAGTTSSRVLKRPHRTDSMNSSFAEVVGLIEQARQRAYPAVNGELVGLYSRIGQHISDKLAAAVWGEGVVDSLAQHLAHTVPGQRGFTRRNLFRMRQSFEAYGTAEQKVTALLTQLPWTRMSGEAHLVSHQKAKMISSRQSGKWRLAVANRILPGALHA